MIEPTAIASPPAHHHFSTVDQGTTMNADAHLDVRRDCGEVLQSSHGLKAGACC